jgi:adenylate cyclase
MLTGYCDRLVTAGIPLATAIIIVDTLHPIHEGRAVRWNRGKEETTITEYGRTNEGDAAASWRRSTFYRLVETGAKSLRRRINDESAAEFTHLAEAREKGITDYLALVNRFAAEGVIGDMDCVYSSWSSDGPQGFSDRDIGVLEGLAPFLAIAIKCASLGRIASTLVETYLGRDAGKLVLSGRIARGVADRIDAVLWFSDLRGYTKITDTAAPEQIIPLLNDYAEAAISVIHANGGDVLKLMGDGVLAIFPASDRKRACNSALAAATQAGEKIASLNERRAAAGLPTTTMYLGLHVGEVFFGNIGSTDRLDFTVVGPAVNEVSRIAAMCRSVDQLVLVSAAFAASLGAGDPRLVCVGRYALRGVGSAQELFTLDPEAGLHAL